MCVTLPLTHDSFDWYTTGMNKSSSSQTVEKVEVNELEDGEISDTDSLPPAK